MQLFGVFALAVQTVFVLFATASSEGAGAPALIRSRGHHGAILQVDSHASFQQPPPALTDVTERRFSIHGEDIPIDIVYCWAGESMQADRETPNDLHEGWGFNEMQVSFAALQKHVPWFNKVYVLVNGPAKPPSWAANESRLVMVDRCTLFPDSQQQYCPTNSTYACQSVVHRIPGLSEHFIAMQDDFFFVKPVEPSHYFSTDGQPVMDFAISADMFDKDAVYGSRETQLKTMKGKSLPPENHPPRMKLTVPDEEAIRHSPMPLRISVLQSMEAEFPEWFAFVRSHIARFECLKHWPEDFSLIWPWMLLTHNAYVAMPMVRGTRCNCYEISCAEECLCDPSTMMVNFNSENLERWHKVHDLLADRLRDGYAMCNPKKTVALSIVVSAVILGIGFYCKVLFRKQSQNTLESTQK